MNYNLRDKDTLLKCSNKNGFVCNNMRGGDCYSETLCINNRTSSCGHLDIYRCISCNINNCGHCYVESCVYCNAPNFHEIHRKKGLICNPDGCIGDIICSQCTLVDGYYQYVPRCDHNNWNCLECDSAHCGPVSYTHLTLPTTPYV